MHGIKKRNLNTEEDQIYRENNKKKVEEIKLLISKIEKINKKETFGKEDLYFNQGILIENMNVAILWNTRKRILTYLKKNTSLIEFESLCQIEMDLTHRCIEIDPKVYCVWNHRLFVFKNLTSPDFINERKIMYKFLTTDSRNFHFWNYLRHIIAIHPILWNEELKQTKFIISQDLSNHSAWHHRSLAIMHHTNCNVFDPQFVSSEMDFLHNAIFTDPSDLAPWPYYSWFISYSSKKKTSKILCVSLKSTKYISLIIITIKNAPQNVFSNIVLKDDNGDVVYLNHDIFEYGEISILVIKTELVEECLHVSLNSQILNIKVDCGGSYDFDYNSHDLSSISRDAQFVKNELDIITSLHNLEPLNRQINLNLIKLLFANDIKKNCDKIMYITENLMKSDPLRAGYYKSILHKCKEASFLCNLKRNDYSHNRNLVAEYKFENINFPWIFVHLMSFEVANKVLDKMQPLIKFLYKELK